MLAGSLLGSVSSIELQGRHLLQKNALGGWDIEPRLQRILTILTDIAELLNSSRLGRLGEHPEPVYKSVQQILVLLYENASVRSHDVSQQTAERAKRSAGVVSYDSWLFVPLAEGDPENRNWLPVLELLQTQLDSIIEDFGQVAQRLRVSSAQRVPTSLSRSVLEMLKLLKKTLGRIVAEQGYVSFRTEHGQESLLETINHKMTALTGDTDA
jgi:hypothetical protein